MTSGQRELGIQTFWLIAILIAFPLSLRADEECGVCHPGPRVAFQDSIHAREEVRCTSCHGGNPDTREVSRAHEGSFRGLGNRLKIPELCASCHSDLELMRPYNQPVDQLAVYRTSQHGKALATGDSSAAVCTDCHGSHDVRSPREPESPTHPRNVAATCAACHADEELVQRYRLDPEVVDNYQSSVHGRALEGGKPGAPDCTSCHGVHGATPPGYGDVDKVCGVCHEQTREAFLEGPHRRGMLEAELPECSSCHENHAIRQFGISGMESLCESCHGPGSAETVLGRKLSALIEGSTAVVDEAEKLTAKGERKALHVEDYLSRIEEARTYLTETLPLVHSVSLEPVEELTRRASSIGEEVQSEIYAKLDRRPAHLGLAVFWFYLLVTLAILFNFKRLLQRGRSDS
jgi:predicted CXXCH cytochrome family protein